MYGLTRATTTLFAAGVAGLLIWLATQISNDNIGGYWARIGLVAGAGLVMALSQLLGGWTTWGWPRLSVPVLLTAFVSLWIILAGEPGSGWFHDHVLSWSSDIHVNGLVTDLLYYIPVLAFGTGLVFGFCFDTTGPVVPDRDVVVAADAAEPRRRGLFGRRRAVTTTPTNERVAADEPLTADRDSVPISTTRTDDRETVTTTHPRDEDRS